ncbi:hypothetical protein [Streptomyces lincolnensis]|uniref:hypothetical protein n=1 Tax=Streptomyces lincolnensis TaxID=1915 RepID=UPI0037D29C1E
MGSEPEIASPGSLPALALTSVMRGGVGADEADLFVVEERDSDVGPISDLGPGPASDLRPNAGRADGRAHGHGTAVQIGDNLDRAPMPTGVGQ